MQKKKHTYKVYVYIRINYYKHKSLYIINLLEEYIIVTKLLNNDQFIL